MRFCYTNPDGVAAIVIAAPKEHLERVFGPLTDQEYRSHVLERSIPPDASDVQQLPDDWTPPSDRIFRNAWVVRDGQIDVDMPRARNVQRGRIRAARKPILADLDVQTLRAVEQQDTGKLAEIVARKQKLRDAPADPRIDAAQTLEELIKISIV